MDAPVLEQLKEIKNSANGNWRRLEKHVAFWRVVC